jgi:hypothetical protein
MSELAVNSKPADGGEAHAAVQTISDNAAADKIGFIIAAPPFFLCFQRKETRQVPIAANMVDALPNWNCSLIRWLAPGTRLLKKARPRAQAGLNKTGSADLGTLADWLLNSLQAS